MRSRLRRAVPLVLALIAGASAPIACGSTNDEIGGGGDAGGDAAVAALTPEAGPSDAGSGGDGDGGPSYPAFRPTVPVVTSGGGPVLVAPVLVPIVFPPTEFKPQITDFVGKAVASAAWKAQLTEYGVGQATVTDTVTATPLPKASLTQAELETYLAPQVSSDAWGAHDTAVFGTKFYVLFLGPAVSITLPSGKTTCTDGPIGFHNEALVGSTHVPYAAVANCGKGLDQITTIAWHEIVEGSADPYALPNRAFFKTDPASWASALSSGEIGDMCEHRTDRKVTPPDIGYSIQRMWSNASAAAYHDPCIPVPSPPTAFFAAAPVLPDMVQHNAATVPGVKVAVGASVTIDVQLFSDGPTSGPFTVAAAESLNGATLAFTWDKTSGQNGDVLHLTIKALVAAPAGGTTFELTSSLGTATSQWIGAVAN